MFKKSSTKGFTLAEVLITLAIIGVVAAMSIPALIGTTNQMEYKVALKKAVSTLNQAIGMSIALDSTDAQSCSNCSDSTNGAAALAAYFKDKLNVIADGAETSSFYTADGMMFKFFKQGSNVCGGNAYSTEVWNGDNTDAACYVLVDVNGSKGPNAEASGSEAEGDAVYKDQFYLVIRGQTVLPAQNDDADPNTVASDAMSY